MSEPTAIVENNKRFIPDELVTSRYTLPPLGTPADPRMFERSDDDYDRWRNRRQAIHEANDHLATIRESEQRMSNPSRSVQIENGMAVGPNE